jgi:hypothetical protein
MIYYIDTWLGHGKVPALQTGGQLVGHMALS